MMRAVIATQPGPPEVLEVIELPNLTPGPGQVVVDVHASGITFIETQMRAGTSPRSPGPFPLVLGNGVAGEVADVGDGVDPAWLGAMVVTSTGGTGGYATQAVAGVDDLHRVPAGLEPTTALALLADGRTALALAEAAAIGRGDTVVVTAAGGGVGSLLVQLASRAGARVIALAGASDKLELARRLGADAAINYRDADWADQLRAATPAGVDVAFDGVGGDTSPVLVERLRGGSRYVPHGAASGRFGGIDQATAVERGITVIPLWSLAPTPEATFALVERALSLAADGELSPTIGQWFPLDRAADAHAAIEARRTIGKTLLIP
ncbi:MAG: alcohol dehydrogenase [Ilumatobacteraceae bacterium]|nr:alcohol dehydrogenase [Ilumatobacteraceae bacterium]